MAETQLTDQQLQIRAWWDEVLPDLPHNARVDLVSICMSIGGNMLDLVHDAAFNNPGRAPEETLRLLTEAMADTEANGPKLRRLLEEHRAPDAVRLPGYGQLGDGNV